MNFSQTVEWTRVENHAYDIFYDSWLLFVYKSYYFFVYISNFNFSNFIEYFANFLNHFNLYGFYKTDKPIERKICQMRRFLSPHVTLDLKKSTLIGWCQMQKKLDKNSHTCNNYIAANCPWINLRNNLRKSYDLYSFKIQPIKKQKKCLSPTN